MSRLFRLGVHLGALALHHGRPLSVGPLQLHRERVRGGGKFLDRDARLDLLAAHHAFISIGPRIALHGSTGDSAHRHVRVVHAVVGVDLFFRTVAEDADTLAGSHRSLPDRMADDGEPPVEPVACIC